MSAQQLEKTLRIIAIVTGVLLVIAVFVIAILFAKADSNKVQCNPELCWKAEIKDDIKLGSDDLPLIREGALMFVTATNAERTAVFGEVWVKTQASYGDEQARGEDRQMWLPVTDLTETPPKWLPVKQD